MEGDIGTETTMETRVRTFVIRFEWRFKWNERNNMGMDLYFIRYWVFGGNTFQYFFFFFNSLKRIWIIIKFLIFLGSEIDWEDKIIKINVLLGVDIFMEYTKIPCLLYSNSWVVRNLIIISIDILIIFLSLKEMNEYI